MHNMSMKGMAIAFVIFFLLGSVCLMGHDAVKKINNQVKNEHSAMVEEEEIEDAEDDAAFIPIKEIANNITILARD